MVAPQFFTRFTECAHLFPLDVAHMTCVNIVGGGHKYLVASKEYLKSWGIPVDVVSEFQPFQFIMKVKCMRTLSLFVKVIQREGEMIVTYPYTAHSGFKCGWNVQEAANFGDEFWIEPAIFAPTCECL